MPLIIGVDHEHREVKIVAIGPVSLEDVREHLSRERADGILDYSQLADLRGAGIPISAAEVHEIAEILREFSRESPLGRTAIVVSSAAELDSMHELEDLVRGFRDTKAFRSEPEAREWLRGDTTKGQSR